MPSFFAKLSQRVTRIPPRAYVALAGLAMLFHGAEKFAAGAGWVLVGILITWDALRDETRDNRK